MWGGQSDWTTLFRTAIPLFVVVEILGFGNNVLMLPTSKCYHVFGSSLFLHHYLWFFTISGVLSSYPSYIHRGTKSSPWIENPTDGRLGGGQSDWPSWPWKCHKYLLGQAQIGLKPSPCQWVGGQILLKRVWGEFEFQVKNWDCVIKLPNITHFRGHISGKKSNVLSTKQKTLIGFHSTLLQRGECLVHANMHWI